MSTRSQRPAPDTRLRAGVASLVSARLRTVAMLTGAGTLVVGIALWVVFPREVHALPAGFCTPIIAFEFARNSADVKGMFMSSDGALDTRLLDSMDLGNAFDYAFLLLYGALLASSAGFAAQLSGDRYRVASALAIVAAGSDAFENRQLLAITQALRERAPFDSQLGLLEQATWTKWGCLVVALAWLSPWLYRVSLAGKVAAACACIATLCAAAAVVQPGVFHEIMSLAVTAAFIALWLALLRWRQSP